MKAICLALFCAILTSSAADLPELVLPQGVGVNIHFTRGHKQDLDLIAAAGFKFVRMDFSWSGTEHQRGEYDWSAYEELTANLEKRGLRALYILDYSNGLYEETVGSKNPISGQEQRTVASPQRPESVAAFARWAAAAAKHFRGRRILWEIWNEPNISFWKPKPDVRQYIALAQATCQAIRAVDPQATLLAPASSGFPWGFLEEMLKAGLLEQLDAVSVHPYRGYTQGPETAGADYRRLRALIARYAPPGKRQMPIISGEWGYATHAKGGVTLDTQAAFIARQQLANLQAGVPLSIWYDWKNDGTNPNHNEHNFGTVTHDLQPKPSYRAVQTLTRELAGYRVVRMLGEHVLLLVNAAGDQKLAAWSVKGNTTALLDLRITNPKAFRIVDGFGQPLPVAMENGKLKLSLTPTPQYVTLKQRSPVLTASAAWHVSVDDPLIVAGQPDNLRLRVQVTNPFPDAAQATIALDFPDGSASHRERLQLAAGETREYVHTRTYTQRTTDKATVAVTVQFEDSPAVPATAARDVPPATVDFFIANPLAVELAPVEAGLQLRVTSPSGAPFAGTAQLADQVTHLHLDRNQPESLAVLKALPAAGAGLPQLVLLDEQGRSVGTVLVPSYRPLSIASYRAALDGDAKVPARATLTATNAPGGADAPFARAFRLNYQFDDGWRFVRCAPQESKTAMLEGHPRALGLWVYGDQSGNSLRMRVTDETGQTFQPTAGNLNWSGWRWVTFRLDRLHQEGRWGGANDGVVHGRLRLDCPVLVDGTKGKTAGTVWFAGLSVVE